MRIARIGQELVVRGLEEDHQAERLIGAAIGQELAGAPGEILGVVDPFVADTNRILTLPAPGVPHVEQFARLAPADPPLAENTGAIPGCFQLGWQAGLQYFGRQRRVDIAAAMMAEA